MPQSSCLTNWCFFFAALWSWPCCADGKLSGKCYFYPWLNWLFDLCFRFCWFVLLPPFFCFVLIWLSSSEHQCLIGLNCLYTSLCVSLHSAARLLVFSMHSPRTLSFCLFSVFSGGTFRFTSPFLLHCTLFRLVLLCCFTGMRNASLDLTLFPKTAIVGNGKNWSSWLWAWFLGFPHHHLIKICSQFWRRKLTSTFKLKYTPDSRNEIFSTDLMWCFITQLLFLAWPLAHPGGKMNPAGVFLEGMVRAGIPSGPYRYVHAPLSLHYRTIIPLGWSSSLCHRSEGFQIIMSVFLLKG